MNRNVESHFSMLPAANISRSRFDRSQDIKFTFNVGEVIPFFWDEVLPGDTFDVTTSKVVRLQTLLTPVMDNIYLDVYFFFEPNRLVYKYWRQVMGENTDSAWLPEVEHSIPQIVFQNDTKVVEEETVEDDENAAVALGDVLDYLGIPTGVSSLSTNLDPLSVSALPLRAYWHIINEWFRSENLVDPINWSDGEADMTYQEVVAAGLDKPFIAAKYHDYFTSALPSSQKGPPVQVPAGFSTTVNGVTSPGWPVITSGNGTGNGAYNLPGGAATDPLRFRLIDGTEVDNKWLQQNVSTGYAALRTVPSVITENRLYPANLYANPGNNQQTGLFVYVNDLRYAFQLQKLYERDARGGSRYIELIRSHFGITSPDSRLQRPEYIGGNRIPISIHQITNQSQGEKDFLGDLGAMSLTTDKHKDFVYSATEHGMIIGLCVARYDHSYPQGIERAWRRKTRFDYYWPVFANLGEDYIRRSEIYADGTEDDNNAFGFQERWAEYRYKPNRVAAEMRPGVANTLDSWHFADYYTEAPTFSAGWLQEDKTNVDRTLAVTSAVANQIFCDIYVKNFTTRPMPLYSIPGLVDHH